MELMLPGLVFGLVFVVAVVVMRRSQGTVTQLARHEMAAVGASTAAPIARTRILAEQRKVSSVGKLADRLSPDEVRFNADPRRAEADGQGGRVGR